MPTPLEDYEIGLIAWIALLAIGGIQGLISAYIEGEELRTAERRPARESWGAVLLIAVLTLLEFVWITLFVQGLFGGATASTLAIYGALLFFSLVALLLVYRRAFVPDEVLMQERDDGVPW